MSFFMWLLGWNDVLQLLKHASRSRDLRAGLCHMFLARKIQDMISYM